MFKSEKNFCVIFLLAISVVVVQSVEQSEDSDGAAVLGYFTSLANDDEIEVFDDKTRNSLTNEELKLEIELISEKEDGDTIFINGPKNPFIDDGFVQKKLPIWPLPWNIPPFFHTPDGETIFKGEVFPQTPSRPVYGVITDFTDTPESQTSESPDLRENLIALGAKTYASLLKKAGLEDVLDYRGSFTIFAPSEAAFGKLINKNSTEYNEVFLKNKTFLSDILLQHIVPRKLMLNDLKHGDRALTLAGNSLVITEFGGLKASGSKIMTGYSDQKAGRGIVHLVGNVIYPVLPKVEAQSVSGLEEFEISPIPSKPQQEKPSKSEDSLVVETNSGKIRGIFVNEDVRAWLGIPYAEPPTGSLRFFPPVQVSQWEEIKNTDQLPNACMQQRDEFFGNFSGSQQWNPNTDISEDCLYLNVFAPAEVQEKVSVLVWIYGGGFTTGSSSLGLYDPSVLITRGNAIFVAMQYRVGAFGFLHLGKKSSSPGNVGLLDQVMALEWIKTNIEAFGGNPDEITIMGESAGAESVALHLLSPVSEDLFHRAILQSSGVMPRWGFITNRESLRRAEKLTKQLECNFTLNDRESTLDCLREKSPVDIVKAQSTAFEYSLNFFPFVPTVDGKFLSTTPEELIQLGKLKNAPIIIGSNANEGFWSLMYLLPKIFPNQELSDHERNLSEEQFKKAISDIFSFYPKIVQKMIRHEYIDSFDGEDAFFKALDRIVANSDFVCDVEQFAQSLANNGNKVYRYFYNHQSSVDPWPQWSGVKHADEIEFIFGRPLKRPEFYSPSEITFSDQMITLWINFVKTGTPNPATYRSLWPEYKSPRWNLLELSPGFRGQDNGNPFLEQCMFWNDIVPQLLRETSNTCRAS